MKRAKLMLGVAALSAALLGTGYAAMTDTVNIGGTVSTANFCVQFKGEPTLELPEGVDKGTWMTKNEIAALTATLDDPKTAGGNSHSITFNAENVKADVPITYSTMIENLSSIDAQFKGAIVTAKAGEKGKIPYPADKVNLEVVIGGGESSMTYKGTLASWTSQPASNKIEELRLQERGKDGNTVPVKFTVTVAEPDETKGEVDNARGSIGFELKFNWAQTQGTASNK